MSAEDYLKAVVGEVAEAFAPLADALASGDALAAFLTDLGWHLDETAATELTTSLATVGDALSTLADDAEAAAELGRLVEDVAGVAAALLGAAPAVAGGLPSPLDQTAFWESLPGDLLEQLLFDHLDAHHQLAFGLLAVLGIAEIRHRLEDETTGRDAYARRSIGVETFARFVADPSDGLRDRFGWGTDTFDHASVLWALGALLRGIQADSDLGPAAPALLDQYFDADSEERIVDQLVVSAPTLSVGDGVAVAKAALVVLPVPPSADTTAAPEGLVLLPTFFGQVAADFPLGDVATLTLSGSATDTPIELYLRPSGVSVEVSVAGIEAQLGVALTVNPTDPVIVAGAAGSSRIELHKAHLGFDATMSAHSLVLDVEAVLDQIRLVVQAGEGDGFLHTVLGDKPIQVDVGPGLAWSSETGLRFAGQNAIDLDIPLDVAVLGVIQLTGLHLALKGGSHDDAVVEVGVSGGLSLGPFAATVQKIGVRLSIAGADPAHPGNLGVLDLGFGFKPPTGVGLAIDTPAVRGGGFLSIDPDAGQYAGVFELTIVGTVSVKAIAIISTKLPDGQPGFALLILITAEGFTPIQLGMGFSLTGIGGLLALNRSIDVDVVRNGLRDGVLDSVLFVKDPVKNAPRVISTLNRVFPIAVGRLVIGPLAEISWGSPPLVKIRLALLLEVPLPIRVVLLAQLRMALPDDKAPVLELNVDAVGVLDLGKGELALDASIHDSRLLKFALSGDLALRLNWGSQPTFLMSVGGFHPKFTPPAGLRQLQRLTLALSDSENPKIVFETYFALTANTIQLGARVALLATAGGFGVDGGGQFDALIQWSPFALDVAFQAWVRIFGPTGTLLGARLALEVTGPEPWHVTGVAELTVLCFSVRVAVDFRVGEAAAVTTGDPVDVAAAIWAEISQPGAWQAVLAPGLGTGATLAPDPDSSIVHPLAQVVGRQKVAPLDAPIARVGANRPTAGTRSYTLRVTAPGGVRVDTATELFAPAQYADLPDDTKLTGPSFASMTAGAMLSGASAASQPSAGIASSVLTVETLDLISLDDDPVAAAPSVPVVV